MLLTGSAAVRFLANCSSGMRYTRDYASLLAASPPFGAHQDQPEIDIHVQDFSAPALPQFSQQ